MMLRSRTKSRRAKAKTARSIREKSVTPDADDDNYGEPYA